MVRDGYFYALAACSAAACSWAGSPAWPGPCRRAAAGGFLSLVFPRSGASDPGRARRGVSPGDGKVTDVSLVTDGGDDAARISIFLSVFDVHVNRSPIAGVIREVRYQRGKFLNAMDQLRRRRTSRISSPWKAKARP